MLLNLIVFKFVPRILKCLDAWRMSFFIFLFFTVTVNLFSYIYIYIYIYEKKRYFSKKRKQMLFVCLAVHVFAFFVFHKPILYHLKDQNFSPFSNTLITMKCFFNYFYSPDILFCTLSF